MDRGKDKQLWNHTSQTLAMLYNLYRGEDDAALEPSDFNPYYSTDKSDSKIMVDDLSFLKQYCRNAEGK